MAYERINWKDYPDKTTPVNANNLNKMDTAIKEHDVAIGDTSEIADIGDGTIAGAIASQNSSLVKKRISYLGVCNNITQTSCNIDFSSFDTVLLVLVKAGFIIGSTECIGINGVSAYSVMAKYSGVDYQGIAWVSKQKITSVIVSDSSVAMHMYGIKY